MLSRDYAAADLPTYAHVTVEVLSRQSELTHTSATRLIVHSHEELSSRGELELTKAPLRSRVRHCWAELLHHVRQGGRGCRLWQRPEALQHERKYRLWWCSHRHNLKGPREQLIERATEGAN